MEEGDYYEGLLDGDDDAEEAEKVGENGKEETANIDNKKNEESEKIGDKEKEETDKNDGKNTKETERIGDKYNKEIEETGEEERKPDEVHVTQVNVVEKEVDKKVLEDTNKDKAGDEKENTNEEQKTNEEEKKSSQE